METSTGLVRDSTSLDRDERRVYVWGGLTGIRYRIRITGRPVSYCGEWLNSSSSKHIGHKKSLEFPWGKMHWFIGES